MGIHRWQFPNGVTWGRANTSATQNLINQNIVGRNCQRKCHELNLIVKIAGGRRDQKTLCISSILNPTTTLTTFSLKVFIA